MSDLVRTLSSKTIVDIDNLARDANDRLIPFQAKTATLTGVTEHDAPLFLQTMTQGSIVSTEILSKLTYLQGKAETNRKYVEGICALEKFPQYVKSAGIKGTADERAAFVNTQSEVISAREAESQLDALVVYVSGIRSALVSAHDDCRKIHFGGKQGRDDMGKVYS